MISNQENFRSFLHHIETPNEESLNEAIKIIKESPQIAELFAQQSPKFVEIFSQLQPEKTPAQIAIKFYQIISIIFKSLIPQKDKFFRSLNYLADSLTGKHLKFLLELMTKKKSRIALKILIQIAKVHSTHCRELFSSFSIIAFTNVDFRKFIEKEGLDKYIKLATIFLNNDVSLQFLSTKYSLSPIWKVLIKAKPKNVLPFIIALTNASEKLNLNSKCWVFNDATLKSLSEFPLSYEKNEMNETTPHAMFLLLESIMKGKKSIIVEDPSRTYCYDPSNLDPQPRNSHILSFLKYLDVWKKPAHRELCLFIFEQSPDLIARFFNDQRREISITLDLSTVSALYFIGKVIEQDWPSFLCEDEKFFEEGRSLDFLFESILPSVLTNHEINNFLKSDSILLRGMIIKILLKSVIKFSKLIQLPQFQKKQDIFTKFRGRIPNSLPQMLFKNEFINVNCQTVFPYILKLIIMLDQVFPFYFADSISKEPPFISDFENIFAKYDPLSQLLILRFIPHLKNPLPQIKRLCNLLVDDSEANQILPPQIMKEVYSTLYTIIKNSDVFSGFENEIPIFIGESIRLNKGDELWKLIDLIKGDFFKFISNKSISPVCNHLISQREKFLKADSNTKALNPLCTCIDLISLMNGNSLEENGSEINLSPAVIMANLKWYALESSTVLLCSSIQHNVTDLNLTLNCLVVVVSCDTDRTLSYVLNHPFMRSSAFKGSEMLDSFIGQCIEWGKGCDDKLALSFLDGNVKPEIVQQIAPFIPEKFIKDLLKKMIKCKVPIRPALVESRSDVISIYEEKIKNLSPFWKWAFKGFEAINLEIIFEIKEEDRKLRRKIFKNQSENILLDLLRTIFISDENPQIRELIEIIALMMKPEEIFEQRDGKRNDRLFAFAIDILPSCRNVKVSESLPVCLLTNSPVDDPISIFVRTGKEWSYEFLFQQIKKSEFDREIQMSDLIDNRDCENKVKSIIQFYLNDQNETFLATFEKVMHEYILNNPQIIEKPPKRESPFFDSIAKEILIPSTLIEYEESKLVGIANILLGTTKEVKISIRVILYLSTSLSTSPSFYQLIEHARISPSSFLFATGEVAKVIIQQLDLNQNIYPSALCRNATYLAPFRQIHQKDSVFEVDTPFFRFLLHFAYYLLSTSAVPLDNYIESGAASILFRALSSKNEHARNIAYASLSELYDLNMKKTDYTYHIQLQLLLETLINAVEKPGMRFTSLITYFLTLASSIIIKPRHTIFTPLIRFLISDKTLRVQSVPLFNDLFDQHDLDFRKQRNWILKMLKNGVCETADVELMKKSKIIEKLCAYFASPLSETKSRALILEILINASKYAKLEGIMVWAYSLMTEQFAIPHIDQIVTLALSIRSKDDVEMDCSYAIAELAWSDFRERLDQSKERVERLVSKHISPSSD